ncbi:Uncharacterised protein [Vibrio cholerae]|nr:Uncharacterised protein [Vibrio cholerae]
MLSPPAKKRSEGESWSNSSTNVLQRPWNSLNRFPVDCVLAVLRSP